MMAIVNMMRSRTAKVAFDTWLEAATEVPEEAEAKMLPLLKVHQQFRYSMLEATTMMPLLKEDQRARKTLDSAYSTLEATTGSLAVVECAITRNSKAVADRLLDEMLAE